MFKSIGLPEIIIILVIILIFFGVGKLPQVSESIGKAIRSFKRAQAGEDEVTASPKKTTKKSTRKSA